MSASCALYAVFGISQSHVTDKLAGSIVSSRDSARDSESVYSILPTHPYSISTHQPLCISIHKPHWSVGIAVFDWEYDYPHGANEKNKSLTAGFDAVLADNRVSLGPWKSSSLTSSIVVGWDGYFLSLCRFAALAWFSQLFRGILSQNSMFFCLLVSRTYHVIVLLSSQISNKIFLNFFKWFENGIGS